MVAFLQGFDSMSWPSGQLERQRKTSKNSIGQQSFKPDHVACNRQSGGINFDV
jgi:hypothetical protein